MTRHSRSAVPSIARVALIVALTALPLAACGGTASHLAAPTNFLELDEPGSSYSQRATSAEGVVLGLAVDPARVKVASADQAGRYAQWQAQRGGDLPSDPAGRLGIEQRVSEEGYDRPDRPAFGEPSAEPARERFGGETPARVDRERAVHGVDGERDERASVSPFERQLQRVAERGEGPGGVAGDDLDPRVAVLDRRLCPKIEQRV